MHDYIHTFCQCCTRLGQGELFLWVATVRLQVGRLVHPETHKNSSDYIAPGLTTAETEQSQNIIMSGF